MTPPDATVPDPVCLWVVPVSDLAGVARHVVDTAVAGIPGWRMVVMAPPGPLVDRCRELGVRTLAEPIGPAAGAPRSLRAVRRAIRRVEPTVVHSHLAFADIVAGVATIGTGVAVVSTEHGIAADDRSHHGSRAESRVMQIVHALRLRRTATVIGVSESTIHQVRARWHPGRNVTLTVVPNGVDPPRPGPARDPGLRIGAMARLAEEKGLVDLVDVFAIVHRAHPDATLRIAGQGPLEAALRARIEELDSAGAAALCGFREPAAFLAELDVLVQLSTWENCSYSLLDAIAAGAGVVATDVGGNPELLPPQCLVPSGDLAAAAAAVIDQGHDTGLRPSLPRTWPSVGAMTRAIAEVYRSAGHARTPRDPTAPGPAITGIDFLANNADVAGGEEMLLRIASAAQALGIDVAVVGPTFSPDLERRAARLHLRFEGITGRDRRAYLMHLARGERRRADDRSRLLWCNGLVPALGTRSSRSRRVVHLHQLPSPRQAHVLRAARRPTDTLVVPSAYLADRIRGAEVLENWTEGLAYSPPADDRPETVRVGFLGRLSPRKGVVTLADALSELERTSPGQFRLVVAGDTRLVPAAEAALARRRLDGCRASITELGWVEPDAFFDQIDLLAVPSMWGEPFGLVAAEAMARGVPVIVADDGALPSVVGPAHPWVVPGGDSGALATVIAAVAADASAAITQTRASRQRWQDRFSPEAGEARLGRLLHDLGVATEPTGAGLG